MKLGVLTVKRVGTLVVHKICCDTMVCCCDTKYVQFKY